MGRFLARLQRRTVAAPAPPPRPAMPPPGVLRRQRRLLQKQREQLVRDLGGIVFEMYRQDRFRADLVQERCHELLELDERLEELDALLTASRTGAVPGRCHCGAPLLWGSHFCANCGRPVGEKAVIACDVCGHALPADAAFCAACGAPAAPPALALEGAAEPAPVPSDPEPPEPVPPAAGGAEPQEPPAEAEPLEPAPEEEPQEAAR